MVGENLKRAVNYTVRKQRFAVSIVCFLHPPLGRISSEWVAGMNRKRVRIYLNRWQVCSGMSGRFHRNEHHGGQRPRMKILCPFVIISLLRIWVRYYRRARKSRAVPGFFLLKRELQVTSF